MQRNPHGGTRPGRLILACACAAVVPACNGLAVRPVLRPPGPSTVRIVFVGDSLVHRTAEEHGLLEGIRGDLLRLHPARDFEVLDAGINGNRIADIEARLDRDVIGLRPSAVVLYWDSDVSDVDESRLMPDEVTQTRTTYERNLRTVLVRLQDAGAFVVMSGPAVIGEQPRRRNKKDPQLDAYRAINRRVAASLKVPYVDARRAFFVQRPADTPSTVDRGLLTVDGEHLNRRGADVVRKLFVRALDSWLRR
jgi:lysophospholipase L1-like esterase